MAICIQDVEIKKIPDKWCDLVMHTMIGGHVGIKVNDTIGPYFKTHKGLRQGDAMSPLLFDIAADALAIILDKAKQHGFVKGVMSEFGNNGVNMLQYADDTIFLIQDDEESARNLKFILSAFEQMSGLSINFHKSEIFLFGEAKEKADLYQEIFTCQKGELPLKYLGLPVSDVRLRNKFWKGVTEKIEKRCACWQGRLLNMAGRVTLVQACLSNIPIYMMSFYPLHVGVRKKADFFRARLVWQENEDKKKYHLVNWKTCCLPRSMGGLGILNLEIMNKALLAKWLWKLETEEGMWIDIIMNKYVNEKCISGIKGKPGDSQFWKSLIQIKGIYYQHVKKKLGDGCNTRFWKDWWVGSKPLKDAYPILYNICFNHEISVAEVINMGWDRFTFRRDIRGDKADLWASLKARCEEVRMYGGKDEPQWMLTVDRKFSIKSLYLFLIKCDIGFKHKFLWKTKVPAKIKMFFWLLVHISILTKDNLIKNGWKGGAGMCVLWARGEY